MTPEGLSKQLVGIVTGLIGSGDTGTLTMDGYLSSPASTPSVTRPKNRAHGDWTSNVAMQLAGRAGMKPRDLAKRIAAGLEDVDGVGSVEVAGPGFINITLDAASAAAVVDKVFAEGAAYGRNTHLGGRTMNLEFVSANPTGPIHIGGTRWAAVGDSLARVLEANGATVVREYYFNDHGEQINRFAKSLVAAWARLTDLGRTKGYCPDVPVDGYRGSYIDDIAARVESEADADGVDLRGLEHHDLGFDGDGDPLGDGDSQLREEFRRRAVPMMFGEIKGSMKEFRVNFDVWFHENSLYADGEVDRAIAELRDRGDIYGKDGATWFASTKYGDDQDRVVVKSDGTHAYFAADIAYYLNKRHREGPDAPSKAADVAIYMLGADHHGYIGRMEAMCRAFGDEPGVNMRILIGQLVRIRRGDDYIRMSKRAGNVVTIDDLVDAVGVDAARYALARVGYDTPLDIDIDLLSSRSNDNPVYYVQYAHARACSVDANAAKAGIDTAKADNSLLDTPADADAIGKLAEWPSVVRSAADDMAPHRIARFLEDLAATYHHWYNVERVVPTGNADPSDTADNPEPARAAARLKLNDAMKQVLANGLDLLGVTAPTAM